MNKKDIIILILIGVSVFMGFLAVYISLHGPSENELNTVNTNQTKNSNKLTDGSNVATQKIPVDMQRYMCGGLPEESINNFIQEFSLPIPCSQPVGIAVDANNRVWVAATFTGHLAIFDPSLKKFTKLIKIPNWKSNGLFGSMVWVMEFDKAGDLWFTDEVSNAIWKYSPSSSNFDIYKIPTHGSYPSSLTFDSKGRAWFSEIFGKKIGYIDPILAENNTSKGIVEYPIKGIDFDTLGPISVGKKDDTVWLTAVTFPYGGSIIKYNIQNETFTTYNLLNGSGVPIGIVEDDSGKLWINDHATNLFFSFEPLTQKIVKYSTSLPTSRNNTTTLPYWNLIRNNSVWFNEHEGNAIAYFDIEHSTLVEFRIPTRSELWGNTSNPLKFTVDNFGSVWFTEWTENNIGLLDYNKWKKLPLVLNLSQNRIVLSKVTLEEKPIQVQVIPNQAELNRKVIMTVAGSMSPSGRLWNMTGEFDKEEFEFPISNTTKKAVPYSLEFKIRPTKDLLPGNYTLSIGARYGDVTISKMIEIIVK